MKTPEKERNSFFRRAAELGFIALVIFAIGTEVTP